MKKTACFVASAMLLALTACGGGQGAGSGNPPSDTTSAKTASTDNAGTTLAPGMVSGTAAHAKLTSADVPSPVFRFYNRQTGVHFFSISPTEVESIRANLPQYVYEGAAFYAMRRSSAGLLPVYRFANLRTGTHLYTISETEKNQVITTMATLFRFEGIGWYARSSAATGWTPIYRLLNQGNGTHFYTASASERDAILTSSLPFFYEGVAYYVHGGGPYPGELPHTGITSSQCFGAGADTLQSCDASNDAVNQLYTQQDGHRTAIHPMAYQAVSNTNAGGDFPITSCVQDITTGLIWEGKEAAGTRAGDRLMTQTQLAGYVNEVNTQQLCGFNDWRVPDVEELQGIVDYSKAWPEPMVHPVWFPNTLAERHWTANVDDSSGYWVVSFRNKTDQTTGILTQSAGMTYPVRLVRGPKWTRERLVVQTATYPTGDSESNVVMDMRTGLRWRRCLEGQQWTGATCAGQPTWYSHSAAMLHTQPLTGWRMPSIKELVSLTRATNNHIQADGSLFPNASHVPHWSTTPYTATEGGAWMTEFGFGWSFGVLRTGTGYVRLVRSD